MPNTWQPCPDGKPQVAHFQKRPFLSQSLALHSALLQWHSFFKYCFSNKKPLFVIGGRWAFVRDKNKKSIPIALEHIFAAWSVVEEAVCACLPMSTFFSYYLFNVLKSCFRFGISIACP